MRRLLICALLVGGCKDSPNAAHPTNTTTPPPATVPTTVIQPSTQLAKSPDRKTVEFVAKTRAFVEEARSAIKLIDLAPSLAEFQKKRAQVNDALTRIPDPPSAELGGIPALAKKISVSLEVSATFLKLAGDFLRLKSEANFKASADDAKKAAAEAKSFVDEIEKLLPAG